MPMIFLTTPISSRSRQLLCIMVTSSVQKKNGVSDRNKFHVATWQNRWRLCLTWYIKQKMILELEYSCTYAWTLERSKIQRSHEQETGCRSDFVCIIWTVTIGKSNRSLLIFEKSIWEAVYFILGDCSQCIPINNARDYSDHMELAVVAMKKMGILSWQKLYPGSCIHLFGCTW